VYVSGPACRHSCRHLEFGYFGKADGSWPLISHVSG